MSDDRVNRQALVLLLFTVGNFVLGYVTAILLARALAWVSSPLELTAPRAALIYAAGWVAGLAGALVFTRTTTPTEVRAADATYTTWPWLVQALPFLFFALLISLLAKVGVLVLEIVSPAEAEVAIYAVALETGTFVYIVAKSTDKLFLPRMSILLERRDVREMVRARHNRLLLMGLICAGFLTTVFVFGRSVLGLFGVEFVAGYPALCIISAATSVWTLFSLSPSFLKYVGRNTFVVASTALAVVAHVGLAVVLGKRWGATGTALSYGLPVVALYVLFAVTAQMSLRCLEPAPRKATRAGIPLPDATLIDVDADEFAV